MITYLYINCIIIALLICNHDEVENIPAYTDIWLIYIIYMYFINTHDIIHWNFTLDTVQVFV
jgi:hypothetical protein